MGVVPPAQRGVAAGARMMLHEQRLRRLDRALDRARHHRRWTRRSSLSIFSGTQVGSSGIDLVPFVNALHLAFWAGVVASAIGAVVSLMRGGHASWEEEAAPGHPVDLTTRPSAAR